MSRLDFLKTVGVFSGLDENEIAQLEPICSERNYHRDDTIFRGGQVIGGGDDARHLSILETGRMDLRFDLPMRESDVETSVATIKPGQCFGWSSLVPPYRYTLSAYCSSDQSKVLELKRDDLVEIFEKDHKIGYVVMGNLSRIIGRRFALLQDEYIKQAGYHMMRW